MVEKRVKRTTIEMPESLFKQIKALAIEKDMTLRELITEALEDKLEKERTKETDQKRIGRGSTSSRLIGVMERFITPDAAITLLIRKCERYGYDPMYLDEEYISEDFLKDLCKSMMYLSNESEDVCFEELKSALEVE